MADTDEIKRGAGRWIRVLLFVSLALNLLVVGVMVGFFLKGAPAGRADRYDPVLPYSRAFDEDQRRDLWTAFRGSLPREGGGLRARHLADYTRALDLLRSETFDVAQMEALLADQVTRGAEVRAQGQKALAAYLAGMSPQARLAYADRLEDELEKMRRRGSRDHGKDRHETKARD